MPSSRSQVNVVLQVADDPNDPNDPNDPDLKLVTFSAADGN
jgi:hypothetical protein